MHAISLRLSLHESYHFACSSWGGKNIHSWTILPIQQKGKHCMEKLLTFLSCMQIFHEREKNSFPALRNSSRHVRNEKDFIYTWGRESRGVFGDPDESCIIFPALGKWDSKKRINNRHDNFANKIFSNVLLFNILFYCLISNRIFKEKNNIYIDTYI